jgi:uncharacterized protein YtpQ (UPF0354 family)
MFGWFKRKKPVLDIKPDRMTLVPRIKTLEFTAALKELNVPEDQLPFTEPLVADLLVAYAFDLPGMFAMANGASISELGIAPGEVRSLAIANLKRQLREIGYEEDGPVRRIVTGENLEACMLLIDDLWNHIAAETASEVVVAVPSRDVVLFCSSRSTEGIAALHQLSIEVLKKESTHALTDQLLVWRDGRWAEFSG